MNVRRDSELPASSSSVLVTGGAGYIGSHVVLALFESGRDVAVIDDLSTGRRDLLPDGVECVVGDVADRDLVGRVLKINRCGAVLHFAGSIVVPESVVDPLKYYRNNTLATEHLIEVCVAEGIDTFVFSSSAAVYGNPTHSPVAETETPQPMSPYGTTKLMTEWMLRDVAAATSLRYAALRYFNVAGADPAMRTGQSTPNATHLIKIACEVALGRRDGMKLFGTDYDTPDGTCVRDYIHVSDLADAHVAALNHVADKRENLVLNCGYGRGYSVREIIDIVGQVVGRPIKVEMTDRRDGDVARLVADNTQILSKLNWRPRHNDIELIVRTALDWERRLSS